MRIKISIILVILFLTSCTKEILQQNLTITVTPINGGSVTPSSAFYERGQKILLLATPSAEYIFKEWKGDLLGDINPSNLIMDSDKNILANFEKRQYPLTISIEGNGTIKEEVISKVTESVYPQGTTVELTPKPNDGWEFAGWAGDLSGKESPKRILIDKQKNITAKFREYVIVPAINTEILPQINWNDHSAGKNTTYDINKDGIPDIISYEAMTNKNTNPAIVKILDYTGKSILDFNIKNYKPSIRDSLGNVLIDYADLNGDGYLDLGLSYMAEWWVGNLGDPGRYANYISNNIFLLLSKNSFNYEVVEILDAPKDPIQFNINIADWDSDGLLDVLYSIYWRGKYLKNLGNNKFEKRTLTPRFNQGIGNKVDFDGDGTLDYVNLFIKQRDESRNLQPGDEKSQVLSVLTSNKLLNFDVIGKNLDKYVYPLNNIISCERISLVDGDLDGDKDLIIGSVKISDTGKWSFHQEYFENTGTHFQYKNNYIEYDEMLIGELQVWVKDLDGDGDEDLFYPTYRKSQLNTNNNKYFWWENTGKGFIINKKFKLIY